MTKWQFLAAACAAGLLVLLIRAFFGVENPAENADPTSADDAEIERLRDKVDGLTADLRNAVQVAYRRGATEWAQLNYPEWAEVFEAEVLGGEAFAAAVTKFAQEAGLIDTIQSQEDAA